MQIAYGLAMWLVYIENIWVSFLEWIGRLTKWVSQILDLHSRQSDRTIPKVTGYCTISYFWIFIIISLDLSSLGIFFDADCIGKKFNKFLQHLRELCCLSLCCATKKVFDSVDCHFSSYRFCSIFCQLSSFFYNWLHC